MKHLKLIAIVVLLSWLGCRKKEYPRPAVSEELTFYSRLNVDGQAVEMIPGRNGYYMYCYFTRDSLNTYNLVGEFKQIGCSTCANSLRIQLNDSKVTQAGSSIDILSALQPKNYPYLEGDKDLGFPLNFTGTTNKAATEVLWDFGDGKTSNILNPSHVFKPGIYTVKLTTKGPNLAQSTIVNEVAVGPNSMNVVVKSTSQQSTVSFTAQPMGGRAPYTYAWDFGDGTTLSGAANVNHTYLIPGSFGAKVKVTDADGRTRLCTYNAFTANDPSAYTSNYSFTNGAEIVTREALSKVSIEYRDATGKRFTSDNAKQDPDASLQVLSVEDFVRNENNEPVKKVKLKFKCKVFNGAQALTLEGTEVVTGFSYR